MRIGHTTRARTLAIFTAFGWIAGQSAFAQVGDLPRRPVFGAGVAAEASGGVRVTQIVPRSPADKAGLQVNDIITSLAARPVFTPGAFLAIVRDTPAGVPVNVQVIRAGNTQVLPVTLTPALRETSPGVDTIYSAVEVDGSLRRTLLSVPSGKPGPMPAVLFVGGIGCYTVDNPSDPHDSYRYLAQDLARAGFVTMRVEKSGVGDSQGAPCFDTDYHAEARMYQIALEALRADPHVDPKQLFLFGHSIGSLLVPRLALEAPVAGVIVAEGVGINWFEYELLNLRRQVELQGMPPAAVDAALRSKELCMHRLLIERQNEADIERALPECKMRNHYPVASAYLQQVAELNVIEPWSRIAVPVLALYGMADYLTAEADHRRIVSVVNASHPGNATLRVIPGMDHTLGIGGTMKAAYDLRNKRQEQTRYDPRLSAEIRGWLCARTKCGVLAPQSRQ